MILSAYFSANSLLCVIKITSLSRDNSFRIDITFSPFFSSREPVGSSASNILLSSRSARAIATLCDSPPLIFLTSLFRYFLMPRFFNIPFCLSASLQHISRFSFTVSPPKRFPSWNIIPKTFCELILPSSLRGFPLKITCPPSGFTIPVRILNRVDLPLPLSPSIATSPLSAKDRFMLSSAVTFLNFLLIPTISSIRPSPY